MKRVQLFLVFALSALFANEVTAVELGTLHYNATLIITMSGPIEAGDAEKFMQFWTENAYDAFTFKVAMDSPGGNLADSIKIGRFLREQSAVTFIEKYPPREPAQSDWEYLEAAIPLGGAGCYSACALAFMGGVNREVPEGAEIGFNQFYAGDDVASAPDVMTDTQTVSAMISSYLREMGAARELFELMSITPPEQLFIPQQDDLNHLGIMPSTAFENFQLMPKEGEVVAVAINPRNQGTLERLYEIETYCWKGRPIINLYAEKADWGLRADYADPLTTHIDGWMLSTSLGMRKFGAESIRLYPEQRLLATLYLDAEAARALSTGGGLISLHSNTASGVLVSGTINTPNGDEAIAVSFKGCI